MKPADFRLQHVDIPAFAADAHPEEGTLDARSLPRMQASLHLESHEGPVEVRWSARGELRRTRGQIETWLHLDIQAEVPLECQRCLETTMEPIDIERSFVFAPHEEQAAQWDADRDEDVLVISRNFDLQALIEDELVLALPIVPRHDVCTKAMRTSVGEEELEAAEAEDPTPHPFAALAQLRKDSNGPSEN